MGPEEQYQAHLAEGDIKLQRCDNCHATIFYPRVLCPDCGSTDLEWQTISGHGEVYSTTTTRRRPDRGGDFNISLVELSEGPRLLSHVENIEPDRVEIGMKVQARISGGEEEGYRLVFDPMEGADHG
ncbi:MAG: DNA-binding protein [Rhodospirillaceae bacterium]|jgi:uncharacterized protein|nr:DNA-binding protein [Rhodospirillaceae bacterium]MBT4940576.1 DNA-binding protein [Rhodospirillaceae bacterium]MBT5938327.1 DNA-binding protein [Rhodospirillaceae bacterium]MBT7266933.1 DNA-binding protein [Rhodospirillaceae bacterium]